MSPPRRPGTFKAIFGQGLAILLPSIVTLWLLWQASVFVFNNVAVPINRGVRGVMLWATPLVVEPDSPLAPDWYVVTEDELAEFRNQNPDVQADQRIRRMIRRDDLRSVWEEHWYANLAGLLVAVLLIYLAGRLFGNYLGREIYSRVERLIARVPGFKQVYPHVKQVVDLIFGENSTIRAFREAVLVQYPREGLWTVGLVTGESFGEVREATGEEMMSVFIPTSPTPMTGFVINVRKRDVIELDITIEQAIRFVVTAGVLTPDNVLSDAQAKSPAAIKGRKDRAGARAQDDGAGGDASGEPGAGGDPHAERPPPPT